MARIDNILKGNPRPRGKDHPQYKHGMRNSPEYSAWQGLRKRCNNPNEPKYPNYGGRGICVCTRWDSFENFYADMGRKPLNTSLGRIDNDGDYCPENCRWETHIQQANNKRNNRKLTLNGRTMTAPQWARELGLNINSINTRLDRGWPDEKTLTTPFEIPTYTHDGLTLTMQQWADRLGVKRKSLDARLARGWSVEKALSTPMRKLKPYS